ncbi:leucyl aminopeptidase [Rickettsia canadensis str. McKiel]|uniref:Leucyl aminopeptidase n=1 Tax=Rickettsia canadensis (strain McKiel) TaxID=293613 RepID=A8EXL3_RICCK|nr:hypothetical protein [Rickettsia canadensis]ABV73096.1 leucyl aminopeptidase [Rickettsia canadensis str. McKiel]WQM43391.1 leucyl aminopeptidase [Rickettsia canadensis]
MQNISENISPEQRKQVDELINKYKHLTLAEQKEVDRKLELHFREKDLERNELQLRMNKIFGNLSRENQEKLQVNNNPINKIKEELLPLIKGIINLVENVAEIIKNPKKVIYEWIKGELNQVKPQQQNHIQSLPKQKNVPTLSR